MAQATAIKILLLSRGISQATISRKTGVDRAIVNKVVSGKLTSGHHATKAAQAIASGTGQPLEDLFPWAVRPKAGAA